MATNGNLLVGSAKTCFRLAFGEGHFPTDAERRLGELP